MSRLAWKLFDGVGGMRHGSWLDVSGFERNCNFWFLLFSLLFWLVWGVWLVLLIWLGVELDLSSPFIENPAVQAFCLFGTSV